MWDIQPTMTLEQLRIFIVVAREQHIRKSSEKLNLTQSAVSSAIKALEDRYQVKLFDRVGRSIELNSLGKAFLGEAEQIVASVKAGEDILTDLSDLKSGQVNVMASRTVGAYWLPSKLVRFHRLYPGVKVHVKIGNSEQVAEAVLSGSTDVGIVERTEVMAGLSYREIARDEMVVVVGSGHPWAQPHSVVRSLSDSVWILRETGSGTRKAFDKLLTTFGTSAEKIVVEMELPDNEAILGTVESGLGATFISRYVASRGLEHGSIAQANIPPMRREYFLLRSEQRHRSKASNAFEASLTD